MEANKFEVKSLSDLIKVFAGIAADFEAKNGCKRADISTEFDEPQHEPQPPVTVAEQKVSTTLPSARKSSSALIRQAFGLVC
ncbi:hypothetical protein [Neisseria gonorrhoeae]|uniref:hypothetical protein n=1 Tax=Neisseria gonorrhoeae TaxID=485 RepID=UPI001F0CA3E8|nr:hypothetical protein [Neisseria gonorrhoeae]